MHRRCQSLVSRAAGTMAPAFIPETTKQGLARNLPETPLRVGPPRPTTHSSIAPLTCVVVRGREVLHGVASPPRVDGMRGVRGPSPLSSTPGQRPSSV
jgi:hypothetical protein